MWLANGIRLRYLEQGDHAGRTVIVLHGLSDSWGERDGIFSRAEQEALIKALPVASLGVYRETGHAPHWERPREVARALQRFLRTTPP